MSQTTPNASLTIGIVLFDRAEELDWVGPFEVFTMAREIAAGMRDAAGAGAAAAASAAADLAVPLISEHGGRVVGAKGMRVEVDHAFADAPDLDVLLIPGGIGTRKELANPAMLDFLRKKAEACQWVTSVCTGSAVLEAAGLCRGKRITTHWGYLPTLRENAAEGTEVLERVRYVRDGQLVTAAGVSAGIDMALWLTGQLFGVPHARLTQRAMEYDPAPPYGAEV
jgi:transcriptional regulator GlxA family with amidase domain